MGRSSGSRRRYPWRIFRRIHGALRYAGPTALVSHRTAAEEWGLAAISDGPVHVTVRYGCSAVSQLPDVIVHRSRAFAHLAVTTVPPRTSRADTIIDMAAAEPTARDAMRCLVGLVTSSTVSLPEIERRLAERPPHRYRRALESAVRRRDNAAELAGRARLIFGWSDVSGDPCAVAGEVASVLRRAGWQGPLRCCPRCS